MKNKKTFKYCEYCDAPIEDLSPPAKENYEKSMIEIYDGIILLPDNIIKNSDDPGSVAVHSNELAGIYCNKTCLINFINNILGA